MLNKQHLVSKILEKYDDKYFRHICSRLIVSLVRDCGEEIYDIFVTQIVPVVAQNIKIVDVNSVETGFKVFASALKFLIKSILRKPVHFLTHFLAALLKIRNPYIRKFTSECVMFLLSKIRDQKELNATVEQVFALSLNDLGIIDENEANLLNKEDFDANLLF